MQIEHPLRGRRRQRGRWAAAATVALSAAAAAAEPFVLEPLGYPENALEPVISARTLSFHHGKHYRAYVENANRLLAGIDIAGQSQAAIIRSLAGQPDRQAAFNNAAQAWNHAFFWKCLKPAGGGAPDGKLAAAIRADFGSFEAFREAFAEAARAQFGSGWVWLVQDQGKLRVVKTDNADTPVAHGWKPLLTIDVWEHSYYLDYQNQRADYIDGVLARLVNWEFVAQNLAAP